MSPLYFVAPVVGCAALGVVVCDDGITFSVELLLGASARAINGDLQTARHDGYRLAYSECPATWRTATDLEVVDIRSELELDDFLYVDSLASQR
uniref:hypothetical protein n=1 Tax=Variovorax sp. PV24 TaxID=1816235 RepID=UPI00159EED4C|nr:hypothetical protein [Variovorax sp. PV24]